MYKGHISAEQLLKEVTKERDSAASHSVLYGIANWHSYNGRHAQAFEIFRTIQASNQWTSFGYIAAEAATPFRLRRS